MKVGGWVSRPKGCEKRVGHGEVHRVAALVAIDDWSALCVSSNHQRGLTSACTRPATRCLSCFFKVAGGRVMRSVRSPEGSATVARKASRRFSEAV
jgi:hypothetical protein